MSNFIASIHFDIVGSSELKTMILQDYMEVDSPAQEQVDPMTLPPRLRRGLSNKIKRPA